MKKSMIILSVVIAYHVGNMKEMSGMFNYAKSRHLQYVRSEFVGNVVVNYFKK